MRTGHSNAFSAAFQRGVTLIELVIFIVVVGATLVILLTVMASQVTHSYDPVASVKALEKGQTLLDEILSRKFDESTPTGGVPACDSAEGVACAGMVADADFDDVADYNNYPDTPDSAYPVTVQVSEAGADLNIANEQARLITVTVGIPGSGSLQLSAYRVNF